MGRTLRLEVPDDVYQSLSQRAERSGQSLESVAVELLAAATQHRDDDPLEQFIGVLSSPCSDWADRHDAYLGKSLRDAMRDEASVERTDA